MIGIIVVAAGSGTRLGGGMPKAFVALGQSTILERSLDSIFRSAGPAQVVIVAPATHLVQAREIAARAAGAASGSICVVEGSTHRQFSVAAGLAALDAAVDVVLVHDAARALTPATVFDAVEHAVRSTGHGIVPASPVTDTVKRVQGSTVVQTVDRSVLVQVQTPQGFPRAPLDEAYEAAAADGIEYTDDAALFAAAGNEVGTIVGDPLAFKITTPWDLQRAERELGLSLDVIPPAGSMRTGLGVDVHAYDQSRELWLGGLLWPGEPGLAGHSDGDALCHAVCDALLSGAGLGDIGGRFGTDDPRFAGAHGDVFLNATLELVAAAGFEIGNVSVQVVGKHPRLSPRRDELQSHLSGLLGAPVSVSATTTDGLGFTGRGEGVTVIATVLLLSAR